MFTNNSSQYTERDLIELTYNASPQLRAWALDQLIQRKPSHLFKRIIEMAEDKSPKVRFYVAQFLGELALPLTEAIETLYKLTKDINPKVRVASLESLIRTKTKIPVAYLDDLLFDASEKVVLKTLTLLDIVPDYQPANSVIVLLAHPSRMVREKAYHHLTKVLAPKNALQVLRQIVDKGLNI